MGEGTCLALVFVGETVLLKPETKSDTDVDYWHRLMMSIKVKDFPEIYGRPVTRHDFMDVGGCSDLVLFYSRFFGTCLYEFVCYLNV